MRRIALSAIALAAIAAAPAQAATPPSAATAPATAVGPLGATLNGSANANGHATRAYFQYGRTKKYGRRTADQQIGEGTTPVPISAVLSGLKSSTTFHFRTVAVSNQGKRFGADRTFKTLAPTTTPVYSPNPAVFGRLVTISGQLVGSGAAGATVTLKVRPFPYTADFGKFGNSVVSNADGTYSFPLPTPVTTFQYEISANTNPPITTPIQTLTVTSLVSLHVRGHVRKNHLLRFSGSAKPAQNGAMVKIQKRTRAGTFRTVAHTFLKRVNAQRSGYSRRLRMKRTGTYRTVVVSNGGAISPGTSPAKSIRVTKRHRHHR